VQGGRQTDSGYELRVGSVPRAVSSLLEFAEAQGLQWAELSTHSASLEDVFVSLTGRQLRDA
jgi:ABC-2 type transport system ATP-binding protein